MTQTKLSNALRKFSRLLSKQTLALLLVLPNLKSPESRSLLKQVDRWTLLSTCDHDGVVSSYRTLKGLANVHHPRMSLALLESASEMQAAKIYRKLCSVCLQLFLYHDEWEDEEAEEGEAE